MITKRSKSVRSLSVAGTMGKLIGLTLVIVVAVALLLKSQGVIPGSTARELLKKSRPRPEGTASLSGVVTTRGKVPIAGASVQLRSFRIVKDAVTDERGQFSFNRLPQGRYDVSASKEGYVRMRYGQRHPFEPITVLEVGAGEAIETLAVELPLAAVISGQIVGQDGIPVQGAVVDVIRASKERPRLGVSRSHLTQDRFPLQADGEFAVLTDAHGRFVIGGLSTVKYYVVASIASDPSRSVRTAQEVSTYVPTYYPGSPDFESAQAIVPSTADHTDLKLVLKPGKRAAIDGWVSKADRSRATGGTVITFVRKKDGEINFDASYSARVRPDGSFSVDVMPDREYVIAASTGHPWSSVGVQRMVETGMTSLHVAGTKVSGIEIKTEPGGVVRGRVVMPSEHAKQGRRLRIHGVAVSEDDAARRVPGSAEVTADGEFVLQNVRGRILLDVGGLNDIAWIKQLRMHGADVTDTGVNVPPGSGVDGVVVELANWTPDAVGIVTKPDGSPAPNCQVLFFSVAQARWSDPLARFTKMTRTSETGNYSVGGLPSGEYLAIAVEHLEIDAAVDTNTLIRLRKWATPVRITNSEKLRLDLREQKPN
jgi:hypothetical protein